MKTQYFEYIKEQLTYIKTKVEIDNGLGLLDINKLSENIFMHLLNSVYDWSLINLNTQFENYPAIDLVDDKNQIVIQVTSTKTSKKIKETIEKYKCDSNYGNYKLKFFYIHEKPSKTTRIRFSSEKLTEEDFIDITDILKEVQTNEEKLKNVYETLSLRFNNISFELNPKTYFEKFEPQLIIETKVFDKYIEKFNEFLHSGKTMLEITSNGGFGKSHLIRYLCRHTNEYKPLIFTKYSAVDKDLKHLRPEQNKYLFVIDDVDRLLDTYLLQTLASYLTLYKENVKLIVSYRLASKSLFKSLARKVNLTQSLDIEITWDDAEIQQLMDAINPHIEASKALHIKQIFNNNPYLITQALVGKYDSVKDFSQKAIDDSIVALKDFNLSDTEIKELLFQLALITPIKLDDLDEKTVKIFNTLSDAKITRILSGRIRFNPDIIGDIYLSDYVENHTSTFQSILEGALQNFSNTIFANLAYALGMSHQPSLESFIKETILSWHGAKDFSHLQAISRVVKFAPQESFVYLQLATREMTPEENPHIEKSGLMAIIPQVSMGGDFNINPNKINLGSIEPIISGLTYIVKNDASSLVTLRHIIDYLLSPIVQNLPKPIYNNHTIKSMLRTLFSPLNTTNFDALLDAIDYIKPKLFDASTQNTVFQLLFLTSIQQLLSPTFDDSSSDGFTYSWGEKTLNLKHPAIVPFIYKIRDIATEMLMSSDERLLLAGLECLRITNHMRMQKLNDKHQVFYSKIKKHLLLKLIERIQSQPALTHKAQSKIDSQSISILTFDDEKNEAFKLLEFLNRSDEYLLFQLVANVKFIVYDYKKFHEEYLQQEDKQKWFLDAQTRRVNHMEFSDNDISMIERISRKYLDCKAIVELFNGLDVSNWGSAGKLLQILNKWFEYNSSALKDSACYLTSLNSEFLKNIYKEFAVKNAILPLTMKALHEGCTNGELSIYVTEIFDKYNTSKMPLLRKIIALSQTRDLTFLRNIITSISQKVFFKLKHDNFDNYQVDFEPLLADLMDILYEFSFEFESYIIYALEAYKDRNEISPRLRKKIIRAIERVDVNIEDYELKHLYDIVDFGLKKNLEIIYKKLTSKKEDGHYRYYFSYYMPHKEISDIHLIEKFIKSYEDFAFLLDKSFEYYNEFIEYYEDNTTKREIRIDLNWFLKHIMTNEYTGRYFDYLYVTSCKEKIAVFYKYVPISRDNLDLIAKNINYLHSFISEDKIIEYLTGVNQIKTYSSAPMENSSELLEEELFFIELSDKIDDLSLNLRIKKELEYIAIRKREEIERDIEFLTRRN
jgi:hypothetical protein